NTNAGSPPTSTPATLIPAGYTAGNDGDVAGTGYISTASSGSALVTINPAFGADGPAASGSTSYALSAVAGNSGVTLTDGTQVNLVQISSTLVLGVVAGQPTTVAFAISMDGTTGVVTVEQYLSLHNPTGGTSYDETTSLTNGALSVIVTVTDGDADTASSNAVNVGSQILFHDDGPAVTASVNASSQVVLDEGNTNAGSPPTSTPATLIPAGYTAGNDLDVAGTGYISTASSGSALVTINPAFGADGPAASGSTSYALAAVAGNSGVTLTDGTQVNLVQISSTLVLGVVAGQPTTVAFAISMDSTTGVVTVEQYLSLHNPTGGSSYDETTSLTNGALSVVVTVTDGDADTASSNAVNVGSQILFHDDGPKASTVTATPVLDDDAQTLFPGNPGGTGDVTNNTVATGAAGALFSAGADGLQAVSFTAPSGLKAIYKDANGLAAQETLHYTTTTAAGGHTIYTAIGDSSGHTVFTLDVGADGSYTFTMSEPLVSPTIGTTEENLSVQIGFTVTDGDNDTATGALTVQVNDDTPGITAGSIQDAILNTVAGSEVHGTWQPVFGADGPNAAAAIAIAIPSTGSGLTYAQTDLGIISGHHVFQIDVSGGTSPYTFYEYSQFNAATQQAEMFAFTDVGLTTSFFTLDVNANGTYDFNLINTSGFEHTVLANASTAKPGNYNPEMFIVGTSFYDGATLPAGTTPDISIDGFDVSGGGHVDENVFVNANGIAVQNGNFEANELMTFHFTGAQTEVQFSLGKFQAGGTSEFTVSLDGGATHTYVINASSPIIDIKASDFGLTSFHDIDLTKIASALATDDPTVDIETIRYNSVTTLDTTSLNFVLTVTDGDGDQFASTADPLTISLIGGGHTLTGTTGPEVLGATSSIETLNGGTGTNDTIDYEHSTAGVNVNLQTNAVSGGWAAGDTISNFENVIGSAFNDTLTALNTGSILDGGANSAGGTDTLIGGNGNDVLIASRAGVDSLTGGGGNDTFVLHGDGATNVSIADFNASGTDGIVVDVADQALTINTAALINAATQFASGNGAPTTGGVGWTESTSADKFYLNTSDNTLWYSANGTGSDQVLLAHMSTGIAPSAIHVA
ncbi:DUF5801 repeats-in-toxin domain-containing protein, partial [Bradyrhizobium iriomotense]|uniref:DUF5801 repeats-in-toxin domain-containing protein n=1 Tax=Bradyrhizobium iriomotense TaxID=441950 RepID=UPI001B8A27BF